MTEMGGEGGGGWYGGRGGGTEEGEAISENKRAFKSKGWKLVRLLFLKNDPCVVLLLRARYILFYLPEETLRGVLAQKEKKKNSARVSFKLRNLLSLRRFLHFFLKSASLWNISQISCLDYIKRYPEISACICCLLPQYLIQKSLLFVRFIYQSKTAECHRVTSQHTLSLSSTHSLFP